MDNMFLLFTSAGWHTVSWTICDNSLERPESRLNIFDMTFELHQNLNIGTTWKSLKKLVGEGGLVCCTQVQQRQEKGPLTRGRKGDMTNGDLHPRPVSVQQFEVKPHSPYQRILQKDILFLVVQNSHSFTKSLLVTHIIYPFTKKVNWLTCEKCSTKVWNMIQTHSIFVTHLKFPIFKFGFFCKRITACTVFDSLRGNLSLAVSPFRIPSSLSLSLSLSLFGSGTKKGNDPLLAAGQWLALPLLEGNPTREEVYFRLVCGNFQLEVDIRQPVWHCNSRCCEYKNAREDMALYPLWQWLVGPWPLMYAQEKKGRRRRGGRCKAISKAKRPFPTYVRTAAHGRWRFHGMVKWSDKGL